MEPVKVNPRTRCGSWHTFVKRYDPVAPPGGEITDMWQQKELPPGIKDEHIWTVLDCDGKLIVTPGYHMVNYMGRVVCSKPWSQTEFMNPGYLW